MRRVVGLALLALALVALWLRSRAVRDDVEAIPDGDLSAGPPAQPPAGAASHRSPSLAQSEATSRRAPVEAAGRAGTARLSGRLIDDETDEPVPWFALELEASDRVRTRVTSDEEGRFATPEPLALGRVGIWLLDDDSAPALQRKVVPLEHGASTGAHEVRIDVGPTYFLELTLPGRLGLADLRARLIQDPPEFDDDRKAPEALVRTPRADRAPEWLRFSDSVDGTPLWLELASEDGLWSGGARVPGGAGVHADPVRIELAPRCAVRGRLVCPGQSGSGELALVQVEDPAAPRWGSSDRSGSFRFDRLTPALYRLEIRNEFLRGEPVTFALREGELDLGDIPCTPIPIAGRVRMHLRSEVEVPLDVELVRRFDQPRYPLWHSDDWNPLPEGGFESLFEWDEVRAGTYEIGVHSHGLGEWHLSLGELQPPVEELTLRLPTPPPTLRLDVVDAASGAALSGWTVLVRGERLWEEPDEARNPLALWDRATPFAVWSPGHRAWIGSGATASASNRITIRLECGWSQLFLARMRSRGRAVADVSIRLDGRLAGTTDSNGELWVHAASPAMRLEVSHPALVWANAEDCAMDELVTWISLRP